MLGFLLPWKSLADRPRNKARRDTEKLSICWRSEPISDALGSDGCVRIKVEVKRGGDNIQLVAETDFFKNRS